MNCRQNSTSIHGMRQLINISAMPLHNYIFLDEGPDL